MTSTAAQRAVARFAAMYGEPRSPDPEAFFEEFARALSGTEPRILDEAVSRTVRDAVFWPKPAEVLAHARVVAAERYRPAEHQPVTERTPPTPVQRARADALVAEMRRALAANIVGGPVAPPAVAASDWARAQSAPGEAIRRSLTPQSRRVQGEREGD